MKVIKWFVLSVVGVGVMAGMVLPEAGKVQREAAKPEVVAEPQKTPEQLAQEKADQAARSAAFKLEVDRRIVAEDTAKASCNFPATFKQPWLGGTVFNESGRVARVKFTCTNGFGVPSEHVMQILFAENSAVVLSAELIQ